MSRQFAEQPDKAEQIYMNALQLKGQAINPSSSLIWSDGTASKQGWSVVWTDIDGDVMTQYLGLWPAQVAVEHLRWLRGQKAERGIYGK